MNTCEDGESGGSTEANCFSGLLVLHVRVDVGSGREVRDVEVPPLSLAALQLVLVEACTAILADFVVVESSALSGSPEWVILAGVCVHLGSAVSELAVFIVTSAIDEEPAEVGDREPLLFILLRCWKITVNLVVNLSAVVVLVCLIDLWLEGRCAHSETCEWVDLVDWHLVLI